MTDEELIARLRDEHVAASRTEAADRIEALIAERDEYHSEAMTYIEKWGAARKAQDEAEAKLASLVEAVDAALACGMIPKSSASEGGANKYIEQVRVSDQLRAALARVKGETK